MGFRAFVEFCFGETGGGILARRPPGWRCYGSQRIANTGKKSIDWGQMALMHGDIISQSSWQKLACAKTATYTPRPFLGDT